MKKSMKKLSRIIVFLLVTMFMIFTMSACFISTLDKVLRMEYVEWLEVDAGISLRKVDAKEFGGIGTMTVNGQVEKLFFSFYNTKGDILNIYKYDVKSLYPVTELTEKRILSVKYRDDKLYVTGTNVEIFGQTYPKLVFEKREIDRSTIDASEYGESLLWKSNIEALKFRMFNYECKKAYGSAMVNGVRKKIIFVWRAQKRFEIYDGNYDLTNASEPIASGTYTNNKNVAVLTFEEDSLYGGAYPTLTLTGEDKPWTDSE